MYLTGLVKPYGCWPRSGDARRMLPRHSDCACMEDVGKTGSRADQFLTMEKAADLTEAGTSYRSGRRPPGLIDAARPRSGVLFAGSRAARPDCM